MRKIKIKWFGIPVFAILFANTVEAQELRVGASGGFAGMKYVDSEFSKGNDLAFSLSYAYYLDSNWSLEIGGEIGMYNLTVKNKELSSSYASVDSEGQAFEFRYNAADHNEKFKGNYYSIPFRVQFESEEINNRNTRIYASAGVRYTMHSKVESSLDVKDLNTSGYYKEWDAELHGPTFAGFGAMGDISEQKKFKLKDSFSVLGEIGAKQYLANGNAVYLGFYATYDLEGSDSKKPELIAYNATGNGSPIKINSALGSGSDGDAFKLRMFSIGLRLKYAFNL